MDGLLKLPARVDDTRLASLLEVLVGARPDRDGRLVIDFSNVGFYVPAATVSIIAAVHSWSGSGVRVLFGGLDRCRVLGYLQRMDFFGVAGIQLTEHFTRRQTAGRFIELKRVDDRTVSEGAISTELAECLFPEFADSADPDESTPFDLVQHAASELILNVRQHSRGHGFISAQRYPQAGLIRVGVADSGIGIRQSFEENAPPFWDPKMTHLDSVRTALLPRASSKQHLPQAWGGAVNWGVGLSILQEITKLACGRFTLVSGNGVIQTHHRTPDSGETNEALLPAPFQGTICALELPIQAGRSLQHLLRDAKVRLRLLNLGSDLDKFFLE